MSGVTAENDALLQRQHESAQRRAEGVRFEDVGERLRAAWVRDGGDGYDTAGTAAAYVAECAADPARQASPEEVAHWRPYIFDPWNEHPPTEFTAEELGWLEGQYEPDVDAYLHARAPRVLKAINTWAHGAPSWRDHLQVLVGLAESTAGRIVYQAIGRLGDAVSYLHLGTGGSRAPAIIEDFLLERQVIIIAGEEGAGKSTLDHEIAHGLLAGKVLGELPVAHGVERVLIVDVEQTEEDARIIRDDLTARGLTLSTEVYWLDASGRSFDNEDDKKWLREQVRIIRPQVIILDTATEAVSKPREDESVKQLYILFGSLLRNEGVLGAIFLAQPRKRSQEAAGARQFDDLFGSRVWKGRSSAVFWIEGEKFTVWKQRGSLLEKRWGGRDGERYAVGRIVRTDGPTLLLGPMSQEDRRKRILQAVTEHPGEFSKTSLVEKHFKITGDADRDRWRRDVDALVTATRLVQEGRHSKLSVTPAAEVTFPRAYVED